MDLDVRDITRLLVGFGLSAVIFMGFWVLWLKTREKAYRRFALIAGPWPFVSIFLVVLGRFLVATGTIHQFETYVTGGRGERVERELAFPVVDAELRHELEIEPPLDQVGMKDTDGMDLEVKRSVAGNLLKVEFQTRRAGSYVLKLDVPAAVSQVRVVAREIR